MSQHNRCNGRAAGSPEHALHDTNRHPPRITHVLLMYTFISQTSNDPAHDVDARPTAALSVGRAVCAGPGQHARPPQWQGCGLAGSTCGIGSMAPRRGCAALAMGGSANALNGTRPSEQGRAGHDAETAGTEAKPPARGRKASHDRTQRSAGVRSILLDQPWGSAATRTRTRLPARVWPTGVGALRTILIDRCMRMFVGMRSRTTLREVMHVLVLAVVHVRMGVRERRGSMPMRMGLGQVQPHACAHQHRRQPE